VVVWAVLTVVSVVVVVLTVFAVVAVMSVVTVFVAFEALRLLLTIAADEAAEPITERTLRLVGLDSESGLNGRLNGRWLGGCGLSNAKDRLNDGLGLGAACVGLGGVHL